MSAKSQPVDLDRPILVQVGELGDAYDAWVHRSIKPRGSLRIFQHPMLEKLSHIPWQLVLIVWVPITLACFLGAVLWQGIPVLPTLGLAGIGFFGWTLLEYVLHRFVFHYRVRSSFGRKFHFLAHGVHHLDPWDPTRLVFPPLPALAISGVVFAFVYLCVSWTAEPLGTALAVMSGVLAGYIAYDMTHYYTHHAKPRSKAGKWLKRYHLEHHHKHPNLLFGVSSPIWDYVFGTARPKG